MARRSFTRAELESYRDVEVPDLLGPGLRLLFVGFNPGLWTAATATHFAHPGNRFYPALLLAGVITDPIDPAAGMTDADRDALRGRGIGITNVVPRATAKASEISTGEYVAGGRRLERLVAIDLRPKLSHAVAQLNDVIQAARSVSAKRAACTQLRLNRG